MCLSGGLLDFLEITQACCSGALEHVSRISCPSTCWRISYGSSPSLTKLHIPVASTLVVWCDNLGAATLAANPVHHTRTKHVDIDIHFIRDMVIRRDLDIRYVLTCDQTSDMLTKNSSVNRFLKLKSKVHVNNSPFRLRGDDSVHSTPT